MPRIPLITDNSPSLLPQQTIDVQRVDNPLEPLSDMLVGLARIAGAKAQKIEGQIGQIKALEQKVKQSEDNTFLAQTKGRWRVEFTEQFEAARQAENPTEFIGQWIKGQQQEIDAIGDPNLRRQVGDEFEAFASAAASDAIRLRASKQAAAERTAIDDNDAHLRNIAMGSATDGDFEAATDEIRANFRSGVGTAYEQDDADRLADASVRVAAIGRYYQLPPDQAADWAKTAVEKYGIEPQFGASLEAQARSEAASFNIGQVRSMWSRSQQIVNDALADPSQVEPSNVKELVNNLADGVMSMPGASDRGALVEGRSVDRNELVTKMLEGSLELASRLPGTPQYFDAIASAMPPTVEARNMVEKFRKQLNENRATQSRKQEAVGDWISAMNGQKPQRSLALDPETQNEFYEQARRDGVSIPRLASVFSSNGSTPPPAMITDLNRMLDPASLDLPQALSTLEAYPTNQARRVASGLQNNLLATAMYDNTRGANAQERARVLGILGSPEVSASMRDIGDTVNGVRKAGKRDEWDHEPLDIIAGTQFDDVPLTSGAFDRFKSRYVLNMVRMTGGLGDKMRFRDEVVKATANEMKDRLVAVRSSSPGSTTLGSDFDKKYLVSADLMGMGTVNQPNKQVVKAYEKAVSGVLSKDFGFQDVTGPFNYMKGEARPDLAFTVTGVQGTIIPWVEEGNAIGFVQWQTDPSVQVSVIDSTNKQVFDTMKLVFDGGAELADRLGDPQIRHRSEYGSDTVLGMVENETKRSILTAVVRQSLMEYRALNSGRNPDLGNAQDRALFETIQDRIARQNFWTGGMGFAPAPNEQP